MCAEEILQCPYVLIGTVDQIVEEHSDIYNDNALPDQINRMCLADTRMFLPGLNLAYTDRASMAASVEVRVPFVDPIVAQAAFSIPGSAKIHQGQSKVALKQAAADWLPQEIVHRPKASFSAPLRAWVRGDLREVINDVLVGGWPGWRTRWRAATWTSDRWWIRRATRSGACRGPATPCGPSCRASSPTIGPAARTAPSRYGSC